MLHPGDRGACPDGASPITALSRAEVQRIVDRFETLNPYNRKPVPGSILKIHKLNWDSKKKRRQLFGYSIAAKRYALYTKADNDIEIVEPKAHGLGYFYPPKDSPKDWKHETPKWIFEAWDWIVRGVLGLERKKPEWFGLPVMMKLTLSTPHHALRNLAKGPLTRPCNFMMLPQISRFGFPENVAPNTFTLITPFTSERDEWIRSKCINIHDCKSPVYELTDEYDVCKVLPKNFFVLLDSYQDHPEAKSLGPEIHANSIHGVCCSERTLSRNHHLSISERNPTDVGKKGKIGVCWCPKLFSTHKKEMRLLMTINWSESQKFPSGN